MDRTTLALPGDQDELIDAVAAVNRRTIVVLNTGGPVLMPWLHHVEGVLQAWYPGQQFGAALASVLFGDSDPGGRLPVTFPAERHAGAGAADAARALPGRQRRAALRRGHLRRLPLVRPVPPAAAVPLRLRPVLRATSASTTCACGPTTARVTATTRVTNTSRRAGSTVAQAYLSFPRSAGEPPRQLKGYEKVQLASGSQRGRHVPPRPRRPRLLRRGRAPAGRRRRPLHAVGGELVARPARSASFELGRHDHR